MTKGIKHTEVGGDLTYTEYHDADAHTVESGTSFPGSPALLDLFYRTDLKALYQYDGTNWKATGEPHTPCSYLMFKDGTNYMSRDGDSGILDSDTDAATIINEVFGLL